MGGHLKCVFALGRDQEAVLSQHMGDLDHPEACLALGRDIALYSVGGAVYATDNTCTHGQARLCDGFLDGHVSAAGYRARARFLGLDER